MKLKTRLAIAFVTFSVLPILFVGLMLSVGQDDDRSAYDHSGTHADVYLRFPDNLGLPFCPASVK